MGTEGVRGAVVCLLGFMAPGACTAVRAQKEARPLRVELLSAHAIASVTMTPLAQHETLMLCSGCRPKAIRKPVTATARGGAVDLGAGVTMKEVELEGAFGVQANGARAISAAGEWTLRVEHGELRVLLKMDSERYVALALQGEAGANEPLESLKAMAIAVRTFALENTARHRGEGFDLCDSTHCQALKFGKTSELVERAVRETAGETLWFGARRALVFYTQNCGGKSEDARQAWPGTRATYLKARADPYCTRHGAAEWHAEVSVTDLQRVAAEAGWKLPAQIGVVRVSRRTDAGRVMRLEFSGDGAAVPVTASSLRFALNRALGWNQLRSDWYSVTLHGGVLRFDGRGYGHGVGLCQAGATQMAVEGHTSAEILEFYFPGTKVGLHAQGGVWHAIHEAGWTLWSSADGAGLAEAGNKAWTRARALYPPQAPDVEPEVWEEPATELFREQTGEPGWVLASTQGTKVFLQPREVLQKGGREEGTLLHEFLHVLVESEASPRTPLWLREGLVETLAGSHALQGSGMADDRRVLDTSLAHPANQAESQHAHAAAGRLAGALVAEEGLERVRSWVRSGDLPDAVVRTLTPARERESAPARDPSTQR
jgi:stage II sporulation protein D